MAINKTIESLKAFEDLAGRQGGSFFLRDERVYFESNAMSAQNGGVGQYYSTARSLRTNSGLKFKFSIYNYFTDTEEAEFGLLINPSDISFGHAFVSSNSFTRQAWVSSLWGSQQKSIACSGTSAAFFIGANLATGDKIFNTGLTATHRKDTLGFINLLALMSLYKNNGCYYLDGAKNVSLFSKNKSRVINVMDSVLLSYDGGEYVGSFNSFTLSEEPSKPFSLSYNFEFVVSCMRGEPMDGHLRMNGNEIRESTDDEIPISIQGQNVEMTKTVSMSVEELNSIFKIGESITSGGIYEPLVSTLSESQLADVNANKSSENQALGSSSGSSVTTVGSGVGTKRVTTYIDENGATKTRVYYEVAPDGSSIKDLTGQQILQNISDTDKDAFGTGKLSTVTLLYGQESSVGGMTNAQFINAAAGKAGFNLDPNVISTILTVEPGPFLKTVDGKAVASPNAVGDGGKSLGITQIYNTTFKSLAKDSGFKSYMESFGYKAELKHEDCKTDSTYALATTIYLLKKESEKPGVGNDPVKLLIAYNAGPGKMNNNELPEATVSYLKTYSNIVNDPKKQASINSSL